MHTRHVVSLAAPVVVEYLPAPHSLQVLDAITEYLPVTQSIQVLDAVAPDISEDLPALQSVHVPGPVNGLYFPGMHTRHVVWLAALVVLEYLPASQSRQVVASFSTSTSKGMCPQGHSL
jgi:hypothetical protein